MLSLWVTRICDSGSEVGGVAMWGGLLFVGTRRGFCEDGLVFVLTTDRLFFIIKTGRDREN